MKTIIALLNLTLIGANALSASYHVATNGNDSDDGSLGTPWLTIQKAVSNAVAGDTVLIHAGEYSEYITNLNSGTTGSPIVFSGERGSGNEWFVILDPSTIVSNSWVEAPEIGTGVFKRTTAFTVSELSISNQRVAFVYSIGDISADISSSYYTNLTTGAQFLALPSTAAFNTKGLNELITWWDGVEALWCANGTTCYLRLRDGSDPNGLDIRVSKAVQAIRNTGQSNIIWSNLMIRGVWGGFYLTGTNTHDVSIASNYISGGYVAVDLTSGAYNNVIRNNDITSAYYGFANPGAWLSDSPTYTNVIRENLYLVAKHLMGQGTSYDMRIRLASSGASNVIAGNNVFNGLGEGIDLSGSVNAPIIGTQINGNTLSNITSLALLVGYGETATQIYNNTILDCNLSFRFSHMNEDGETNRVVHIYRNKCWQPDISGNHIYFHFNSGVTEYKPEYWIYHNSFAGGDGAIDISSYVTTNGGLTGVRFLDNIFSGTKYLTIDNSALTNINTVGLFDYNLITSPFPSYPTTNFPPWVLSNNIIVNSAVWNTNKVPDFTLTNGSPAIDSALDVFQTFSIGGTNHAALPAGLEQRYGSGWDIGALEYGTEIKSQAIGNYQLSGNVTIQ